MPPACSDPLPRRDRLARTLSRALARTLILPGVLILLAAPRFAEATPHDGRPKILLHAMSVSAKNPCGRAALADCQAAVTSGTVGTPSFVYLLGARGSLPSISAVECGLRYQDDVPGARDDGTGIDILSWSRCATIEFPSLEPLPWPAAGGGNLIVYDAVQSCQTNETAVMGYLYVSAYSPGTLYLMPRPASGRATVTDCGASETTLATMDLGSVAFTTAGGSGGCNPCSGPCPEAPPPPPPPPPPPLPPAHCELTIATNTTFPIVRLHDGNHHRKLTIRNVGGERMTGHLTLDSDQFYMGSGINTYSLMGGESKDFWVTFHPFEVGDHEAKLTTGADCPLVYFTGTAVPYAECYIGPVNSEFAETQIGKFREVPVSVQNRGPGPVSGTLFLAGCGPDFTLIGDPEFDLGWGEWAELRLRFAPTRTGRQECAITSTTFCYPGNIAGYGYAGEPTPPVCSLEQTTVDFGEVVVGQRGDATLHVMNIGGGVLHPAIAPTCPPFRSKHDFSTRFNLHAGESGGFWLEFVPTAAGPVACQLQVAGCEPVTLTGIGRLPGPGLLAPEAIDFGTVPAGTATERAFTVTNTGGARIRGAIRSNRAEFVLVGADAYDLLPGQSASFRVRFQSPELGEHRGTLDAGTESSMLPLAAVTEAPMPIQPSSWSGIKSRFGH